MRAVEPKFAAVCCRVRDCIHYTAGTSKAPPAHRRSGALCRGAGCRVTHATLANSEQVAVLEASVLGSIDASSAVTTPHGRGVALAARKRALAATTVRGAELVAVHGCAHAAGKLAPPGRGLRVLGAGKHPAADDGPAAARLVAALPAAMGDAEAKSRHRPILALGQAFGFATPATAVPRASVKAVDRTFGAAGLQASRATPVAHATPAFCHCPSGAALGATPPGGVECGVLGAGGGRHAAQPLATRHPAQHPFPRVGLAPRPLAGERLNTPRYGTALATAMLPAPVRGV